MTSDILDCRIFLTLPRFVLLILEILPSQINMADQYTIRNSPKKGLVFSGAPPFLRSEPAPGETCWLCPKNTGVGRFHKIVLQPGLELWISDCLFHRKIEFRHWDMPSMLQFSFYLSGHYQILYDSRKKITEYEGEHQGFYSLNSTNPVYSVMADIPVLGVSLSVYPEFFLAYGGNGTNGLPSILAECMRPGMESGCRYSGLLSTQTREIIRGIIDCKLSGFNRKIFLESKALELLFSQLNQLDDTTARCRKTCGLACTLDPQDKKQAEEARNQLLKNMETPPSLYDLARSAGMSHPKLNRCFKHMYGMTVFQYLRYERLNKARGMLENEGVTVTETAYQVGYDSLSHFSQAYKKQFGNSPSSSLRVE